MDSDTRHAERAAAEAGALVSVGHPRPASGHEGQASAQASKTGDATKPLRSLPARQRGSAGASQRPRQKARQRGSEGLGARAAVALAPPI